MNPKQWIPKSLESWNRFWFEAECGPQFRIFRACFALMMFVVYAIRSLDLELFYSDHGLVKLSVLDELLPLTYRFSVFHLFPGTTALWIGNLVFLSSLLALAFGIYPRIAAIVASILHISFLHRNLGASYGVDTIATFYFLYLCMADYRDRGHRLIEKGGDWQSVLGSMAFRLCQIQICVIYGYSGLHKLRGIYWWKGGGVWAVLANSQMATMDFTWTSHFPLILTVASFASLAWEVYFPVLIWVRALRIPMLVFGVLFHLGIAFSIGIPFFAFLMIFIYVFHLDAAHCVVIEGFFTHCLRFAHFSRKVLTAPAEENSV